MRSTKILENTVQLKLSEVSMSDCIFCQIVFGKAPSYKIYEDKDYLAFLNLYPFSWGHTLVIPKKHYRWVWDVEDIGGYFKACQKIANHFQKTTGKEMIISHVFGEGVEHAHVHLIPNKKGYAKKLFSRVNDMVEGKLKKSDAKKMVEKLSL